MFLHLMFENIFPEAFTMQFVELPADNLCNLYVEPIGVDIRKRFSYLWTITLSIYLRLIKPRVVRLSQIM